MEEARRAGEGEAATLEEDGEIKGRAADGHPVFAETLRRQGTAGRWAAGDLSGRDEPVRGYGA
jgi:hypothetical protein